MDALLGELQVASCPLPVASCQLQVGSCCWLWPVEELKSSTRRRWTLPEIDRKNRNRKLKQNKAKANQEEEVPTIVGHQRQKMKLKLQKKQYNTKGQKTKQKKKKEIQNIKLNKKECEAICSKCGKLAQWSKVRGKGVKKCRKCELKI